MRKAYKCGECGEPEPEPTEDGESRCCRAAVVPMHSNQTDQTSQDAATLQRLDADALAVVVGVRPMVADGGSADAYRLYVAADVRLWSAVKDAEARRSVPVIGHPEGNSAVAYHDAIGALSGVPARGR